jgi:uncharacterized protein (DUF2141 family)
MLNKGLILQKAIGRLFLQRFLGIPAEKYGFSNNILPALIPATFKEPVFELTHQEMIIHMQTFC